MVYPEFGWLLDPSPVVCHKETVSIANARASLARAQGHLAGARRGGSDVPELAEALSRSVDALAECLDAVREVVTELDRPGRGRPR